MEGYPAFRLFDKVDREKRNAGGGVLAVRGPAYADFKNAVVAYDRGQFDSALHEFRAMAETGHAGAEFMLGAIYFYGKGVQPDHTIAAIWFHKSAIKGNASAQLAFGSLHIRGLGVQQDLIEAYRWLTNRRGRGG